jgi:hypothetical protein
LTAFPRMFATTWRTRLRSQSVGGMRWAREMRALLAQMPEDRQRKLIGASSTPSAGLPNRGRAVGSDRPQGGTPGGTRTPDPRLKNPHDWFEMPRG